jgi:hypothetical protein
MTSPLRITTRVLPGHKVVVTAPDLAEGQTVDVILVPQAAEVGPRQSMFDLIQSLPPGPRSAPSWEEIEAQFKRERDAWDR